MRDFLPSYILRLKFSKGLNPENLFPHGRLTEFAFIAIAFATRSGQCYVIDQVLQQIEDSASMNSENQAMVIRVL